MEQRKQIKYPTFNEAAAGKTIVSMIKFNDNIYVATQKGVYILDDDKLKRLEFVQDEQ